MHNDCSLIHNNRSEDDDENKNKRAQTDSLAIYKVWTLCMF